MHIKTLLFLTIGLSSLLNATVTQRTPIRPPHIKSYKSHYSYSSSYISKNYYLEYKRFENKYRKEKQAVSNAKRKIKHLEYQNQNLRREIEYLKRKSNKRINPKIRIKRDEALLKMKKQLFQKKNMKDEIVNKIIIK